MGGQERAGFEQMAVRCIICNRIKQAVGQETPWDLHGMRCDEACPGYTMDPLPATQDPVFQRMAPASVGPVAALSQEPVDVIGRALIRTHFGM